jgi:hypothetical protein
LLETQQARSTEGLARILASSVDGDVRERGGDEMRQLTLEPFKLPTQRASCGTLVDPLDGRYALLDPVDR